MDGPNMAEILDSLYMQESDKIHQFAFYMLGNRATAEDVVQEVFLRAVRSFHTVRDGGNYRAWLWTIARHYITDVHRTRLRRKEGLTDEFDQMPDPRAARVDALLRIADSMIPS